MTVPSPMLTLPPELPLTAISDTPAVNVWSPNFDRCTGVPLVYAFWRTSDQRVLFVSKTLAGRDRMRWHLQNSIPRALHTDDLRLTVYQLTAQHTHAEMIAMALETIVSTLIAVWLPPFNNARAALKDAHA